MPAVCGKALAADARTVCEGRDEEEKYRGRRRENRFPFSLPMEKKNPLDYELFKEYIKCLKLTLHILLPGLSLGHP